MSVLSFVFVFVFFVVSALSTVCVQIESYNDTRNPKVGWFMADTMCICICICVCILFVFIIVFVFVFISVLASVRSD